MDALEAQIQWSVTVVGNDVEAPIHPPVMIVDKNVVKPTIPQSITAIDKKCGSEKSKKEKRSIAR